MSQTLDPSLISVHSSWPGLIADLSLHHGSFSLNANTTDTAPVILANGDWVQIEGASSAGSFALYLPAKVCAMILEAGDASLDITQLDGTIAAMIFEHVTSYRIDQLEEVLGCDLALHQIVDVSTSVSEKLHGLEIELNGEVYKAALSVSGKLFEWFEFVVNNNSNLDERRLSERMSVQLGPVVLPNRQAYLVRSGEIIDCGVVPSDVIHGILLREDKRYWPIYIEDNAIEISGPLAGPVEFPEENNDQIFVTFGIGEVKLSAMERSHLTQGSRLDVVRYNDNGTKIYYQTKPFAQGHLSLHENNLAVTLSSIGAFTD